MNYRIKILFALTALFVLTRFYTSRQSVIFLMTMILLISGVYMFGLIRLWRGAGLGHGIPVWRAACFFGGMAILALALSDPMDELADGALSMHMIQHMLLMKIIAPLLLLGEFMPIFFWAIGKNAARWTGGAWIQSQRLGQFWKKLTNPWTAWTLFALCLWICHMPELYQAALKNEALHDMEHLLFLGTSLLFWWYLFQTGRDQTIRYGTAVLYLFTTLLHESMLGALLTFSSKIWYTFYSVFSPLGLSPLADQQLAGVIMWLPGGIILTLLIVFYFGAWLQAIEKRMQISPPEFVAKGDQK